MTSVEVPVQSSGIQTAQAPALTNSSPPKEDKFCGKPVVVLGAIQILFGVTCIVCNSIGLALHALLMVLGHGFWAGALISISGIVACLAGIKKKRGLIISCLVLSVIMLLVTITLLCISAIGWGVEEYNTFYLYTTPSATLQDGNNNYMQYYYKTNLSARQATNAILVVVSLLQTIVAIIVSGFGCHRLCRCCHVQQGTVLSSGPVTQTLIISQASGQSLQYIMLQGQPTVQQTAEPVRSTQVNSPDPHNEGYEVPAGRITSLGPPSCYAPSPPVDTEEPPAFEEVYDTIPDSHLYVQLQNTDYVNVWK